MTIGSSTATGFAASILAATVGGCQQSGSGRAARDLPDVLVVTIDTARADRFSHTSRSSLDTPSFDAIARDGTVFSTAVTTAPLTLPAHASLFTGQEPPGHGVRNNGSFHLRDESITLAELLRARGYRTAAFVGAAVLASSVGLAQGFDVYDDTLPSHSAAHSFPERSGDVVVDSAATWLAEQPPGPTFVWVHLYDPHFPYQPPSPERERYALAPYDGEIAFADRMVGRLLETYEQLDRYTGAVVAVTSDHGESLGEHDEQAHGVLLYESAIRIPLAIKLPKPAAAKRVTTPVSIVDVMPTILDAVGVNLPEESRGMSLLPVMNGGQLPLRPLYSESLAPLLDYGWAPLRALRTNTWKLILGREVELYDVSQDPRETNDVASERQTLAADLTRALDDTFGPLALDRSAGAAPSDEQVRQLRALGYVGGPATGTELNQASRPSPRRQVRHLVTMDNGSRLFELGKRAEGIATLERLLGDDGANPELRARLAGMYLRSGRSADAVREYQRAIELAPGNPRLWRQKRLARQKLGEPDAVTRAQTLYRSGQPASAIALLEEAVDSTPGDPDLWATLAIIHLRAGRTEDGVACYERGLAVGLDGRDTWANLAIAYRKLGRLAAAEKAERRLHLFLGEHE